MINTVRDAQYKAGLVCSSRRCLFKYPPSAFWHVTGFNWYQLVPVKTSQKVTSEPFEYFELTSKYATSRKSPPLTCKQPREHFGEAWHHWWGSQHHLQHHQLILSSPGTVLGTSWHSRQPADALPPRLHKYAINECRHLLSCWYIPLMLSAAFFALPGKCREALLFSTSILAGSTSNQ